MFNFLSKKLHLDTALPIEVCISKLENELDLNLFELNQPLLYRIGNIDKSVKIIRINDDLWEYRIEMKRGRFSIPLGGIKGDIRSINGRTIITGETYTPLLQQIFYAPFLIISLLLILIGMKFALFFLIGVFVLFTAFIQYRYNTEQFSEILVNAIKNKLQ